MVEKFFTRLSLALIITSFSLALPQISSAEDSSISLLPVSKTVVEGETFDISIIIDTHNNSVEYVDATLSFPIENLQLASSDTSKSLIQEWIEPPSFDNSQGLVSLVGRIPEGIKTSNGVIINLTFRARSAGSAVISFRSTDRSLASGIYKIVPAMPNGPRIYSETHPTQDAWHNSTLAIMHWDEVAGANGYSYLLDDVPFSVPDEVIETKESNVVFEELKNGVHYFHLRAVNSTQDLSASHYKLLIDNEPPHDFKIRISPGSWLKNSEQPIVEFKTEDSLSGLSHYSVKLSGQVKGATAGVGAVVSGEESRDEFIEAQSPFIYSELMPPGDYNIVVRAYDNAGNYNESVRGVKVVGGFGARSLYDYLLLFINRFTLQSLLLLFVAALSLIFIVLLIHKAIKSSVKN